MVERIVGWQWNNDNMAGVVSKKCDGVLGRQDG